MEVLKTELEGVLIIKPDIFKDHRGEYFQIYSQETFAHKGVHVRFLQDDISTSRKNVLRGIHGDQETWKLVSCLLGEFYLVIVNCNESNAKFGKWQSFTLSEETKHQVLVPPTYGVAHLALTDKIIFYYKQSTYYDPSRQFTYRWNDPRFNIQWPIEKPILSKRDELGHYV